MFEDADFKMTRTVLTSKRDWPAWFCTLRMAAEVRLIWDHINPEATNSDYFLQRPLKPSLPKRPPEGDLEARALYEFERDDFLMACRDYSMRWGDWTASHDHYVAISDWVFNTVKREYAVAAHCRLLDPMVAANPPGAAQDTPTTKKANYLQRLLRELKRQFEPGTSSRRYPS